MKRSAAQHAIGGSREGAQGDEAKSEDLPMDRVSLSSVSKKDMFRFRRAAAKQFRRDVSAKNLIYPVFTVRSALRRAKSPGTTTGSAVKRSRLYKGVYGRLFLYADHS